MSEVSTVLAGARGFKRHPLAPDPHPRFLPAADMSYDYWKSSTTTGRKNGGRSAANWMGYHLSTLVALHEFFAARGDENPVPDFLVIDQPSQAYFPSDTYEERVGAGRASEKRLSDLAKTQQIFEFLVRVKASAAPHLQIIVVEHADERTWVGLEEGVVKVRDWRASGDRLIPREWLTDLNGQ